jgi:hypothetical protein
MTTKPEIHYLNHIKKQLEIYGTDIKNDWQELIFEVPDTIQLRLEEYKITHSSIFIYDDICHFVGGIRNQRFKDLYHSLVTQRNMAQSAHINYIYHLCILSNVIIDASLVSDETFSSVCYAIANMESFDKTALGIIYVE